MKDLRRQAKINTQLLQSLLDMKNSCDDSVLDTHELPIQDSRDLDTFENVLKGDKYVFSKLVRMYFKWNVNTIYSCISDFLFFQH